MKATFYGMTIKVVFFFFKNPDATSLDLLMRGYFRTKFVILNSLLSQNRSYFLLLWERSPPQWDVMYFFPPTKAKPIKSRNNLIFSTQIDCNFLQNLLSRNACFFAAEDVWSDWQVVSHWVKGTKSNNDSSEVWAMAKKPTCSYPSSNHTPLQITQGPAL